MDPNTVILDISSDEDVDWEEPRDDQLDWISELFGTVDKENEESDEVVVVREVSGSPALQKQSYKPWDAVKSASIRDDLDDDCLILDDDPDKPVSIVDDTQNGSDELLIVGEKGPLACRDFPHSRHMCGRFDFSTTPHEKYCDMCHCYVCDSRAPCIYWGTGASSIDHCHSTDKEEVWKIQRDYFKGKTAPPPLHKVSESTLPMRLPLHKSGPALTLSEPLNCTSVPLHPLSKSSPLRACPSTTSFGVPSIISHRNNQLSGSTLGRNRFSHQGGRSHLIRATNNSSRRVRSGVGGSLGPHFVSPQSSYKRVGSTGGVLTKNQYGYGSSSNNNHLHISQPQRNRCPPVIHHHDDINNRSHQDFFATIDTELSTCRSSSQPNIGSSFVDSQSYNISSQPQVHSQPVPQSNENQDMYSHKGPAPNATNPNSLGFDFSWLNDTTHSLTPTTENSQLPSLQPTSEPSPVTEPVPLCPGDTNPGLTDFDLDSWFHSMPHQPSPESAKEAVPSELDFVSIQADLVNAEMLLFDFENS